MSMTYSELISNLKTVDEISLLEALEITSDELVEAFRDKIDERTEKLLEYFEEESFQEE